MRYRNINIPLRVSESEARIINEKAKKAKLNRTDYMVACAVGKHISVVEDLKPIITELKRIGNNLNQLTVLAHTGKISAVTLDEAEEALTKIYDEVYRIAREKDGE